MTVHCTNDGTAHPDDANFCMRCGRPLHSTVPKRQGLGSGRWEYQQVEIPLDVEWISDRDGSPTAARKLILQKVFKHVQELGQEGWEPDESIDDVTYKMRMSEKKINWFTTISVATSVTIRFKRFVI